MLEPPPQNGARRGLASSNAPRPSTPAPPRRYIAYIADVSADAPHALLWSSPWTALPDPGELNVIHLSLAVVPLDPQRFLYAASVSDEFQSPFRRRQQLERARFALGG